MKTKFVFSGAAVALAAAVWLAGPAPANSQSSLPKPFEGFLQPLEDLLQIFEPKLVFVTSDDFTGDLGGLSGADEKCQAAADAEGLDGVYQAWLSDTVESPSTRWATLSLGPYILLTGGVVAASFGDLVDGTINDNINITETGGAKGGAAVWGGTEATGAKNGPFCDEWTQGVTGAPFANTGSTDRTDSKWAFGAGFSSGCNNNYALYCFGQ